MPALIQFFGFLYGCIFTLQNSTLSLSLLPYRIVSCHLFQRITGRKIRQFIQLNFGQNVCHCSCVPFCVFLLSLLLFLSALCLPPFLLSLSILLFKLLLLFSCLLFIIIGIDPPVRPEDPSLPAGHTRCEFCGIIGELETFLAPSRR